jgi:signal transduction histidine kinase/ActR/RegA family two-component response regulator
LNIPDLSMEMQRVLLLLGTTRDAKLTCELLERNAIASHACGSAEQLRAQIDAGAGAVLVAEECLDSGAHEALLHALEGQPAWSDLPILVLARSGADSVTVGDALASLGNVTLLERPLRVAGLVSVVRTALRARFRQYQIQANLKTLEEARDAEAREAQRKDEFLAMLAHELRNPLAPIRTALFVLGMDDSNVERRHSLRQMMERQVDHLVRLVDDLLESSRLSRGKIQLQRESIDLKDALMRAIELSRPQIDAAQCTLELHLPRDPLPIDADPIRIAQVFSNLLNNAARYGRRGGVIHLHAERTADQHQALVRVVDNGIGIDAETLPHVFELFTQGKREASHAQGGLGIGLALVRALVEQHGGRVSADSAGRGLGAEFSVWLSLSGLEGKSPALSSPSRAAAPGTRVLLVDDNEDAANSLAMLLDAEGIEHRVVHDGPSALVAADEFRPDVVLLDIGMPGMDGYEVARRLRAQPFHARARLVALTGWSYEQDQARSRAAGFDHHLRKPAQIDELMALLTSIDPPLRPPGHPHPAAARPAAPAVSPR